MSSAWIGGPESHLLVSEVSFRHARRAPMLFTDLSFTVVAGELTVIEGQNGVGKSTLLELCAGLRTPLAGTVRHQVRFAYLPQTASSLQPQLTGLEHARLFSAACGLDARESGTRLGATLEALAFPVPDLERRVGRLSGGNRQKLNLSLTLIDDRAPLLLLDEPYAGFDAGSLGLLMDLFDHLLKDGKSIVMVNHLTDPRLRIDRVVRLHGPQHAGRSDHARPRPARQVDDPAEQL